MKCSVCGNQNCACDKGGKCNCGPGCGCSKKK
jgi:hypothetical protein